MWLPEGWQGRQLVQPRMLGSYARLWKQRGEDTGGSCIRDIQRARRGLVPMRSAAVKNEDGSVCATMEAQGER